jgi:ribosomal protein S19E (S16A)
MWCDCDLFRCNCDNFLGSHLPKEDKIKNLGWSKSIKSALMREVPPSNFTSDI